MNFLILQAYGKIQTITTRKNLQEQVANFDPGSRYDSL